jgi:hypothetical protein
MVSDIFLFVMYPHLDIVTFPCGEEFFVGLVNPSIKLEYVEPDI